MGKSTSDVDFYGETRVQFARQPDVDRAATR